MREVFPPKPRQFTRGPVFYTIRPEDVGKITIETEIGNIPFSQIGGRVLKRDVGKRIYGVGSHGQFTWTMENDEQRDSRIGK